MEYKDYIEEQIKHQEIIKIIQKRERFALFIGFIIGLIIGIII
jgi:hypothetical protein